jgi:signal transduction histidine kinase
MVVEDGTVQAATSREESLRRGLRVLAHELTTAEARERERIARDLHDEIGQILTVARFMVQQLKGMPPARQGPHIDELADMLAQASRATRSATFDLSSKVLDLGLEEALVELAGRLSRAGGAVFRVDGHLPPVEWPEPARWVLYRVVRELASNVQRHARAHLAIIRLGGDARGLTIAVTDDGVGIDADWASRGPSREGGFGLVSAHSQMQALGGTLVVESGIGSGTCATVSLPVNGLLSP